MCCYRKIDYHRALRLFISLLIYGQLNRAIYVNTETEKMIRNFYMSRGTRCSWQPGNSCSSLPPSLLHPPPAWLALLFEFLQCDKKRSKQKGKGPRPRCTKHPPGTSSVAFSVRSIQFSILQKKKKKPSERNLGRFCE